MSWSLLVILVLALGLALLAALARRRELARMRGKVRERDAAVAEGTARSELLHPVIDLSRCLGCGTCVMACPEDGVLELVHGQAMVVRGARCKGIAACARECPVSAITVTIADLAERRDVPAIDDELEAIGSPGLFLAGEVTAHALVKTAIDHGTAVATEVARRAVDRVPSLVRPAEGARPSGAARVALLQGGDEGVLDLCVVGAGPAGLACSLEAKRRGLRFVTIEQEKELGGTVAKYPRRKLVVSQPIVMPFHGKLGKTTFTKEELVELWSGLAREAELPIETGIVFEGCERGPDGVYTVHTKSGEVRARNVCLAVGRRGTPRKLGVPGEEQAKVAYSLLDAHSYQGRRILVVGGGDSAVEAALGLAEQPGNEVTISYRKETFFRIRTRNVERLEEALAAGRLRVLFRSRVRAIRATEVELDVPGSAGDETVTLANDDVFVLVGGVPPVALLERAGASLDPSLRPVPAAPGERGAGLVRALAIGFGVSLVALAWALWNLDYYVLPLPERPAHPLHAFLRPGMGAGLWLGIASASLIALNLLYLVRRAPGLRLRLGSLQAWMTGHIATGVLAFLCACLHAAMAPRNSVGGHAFWALLVLLVTGAIGRYFYAYVPRAANGRELDLAEVKTRLGRLSDEWDQGQRRFREVARDEVCRLIDARQWKSSFLGRVLGLFGVQRDLRRLIARLHREGRAQGIDEEQIAETVAVARRAHRTALMAAHYEDLRAILSSWRWLHRWMAALLVLLVVLHVVNAFFYGTFFDGSAG